MRRTRILVCTAFGAGAVMALFVEHVGAQSPVRTLLFLGIVLAVAWWGRLSFDHSDESPAAITPPEWLTGIDVICDPLCPPGTAYLTNDIVHEPDDYEWMIDDPVSTLDDATAERIRARIIAGPDFMAGARRRMGKFSAET